MRYEDVELHNVCDIIEDDGGSWQASSPLKQ